MTGAGHSRANLGRDGEFIVRQRLVASGWRLRETNWRCRAGEIDIVAQDGDCLVIVEVRTRRSGGAGRPEDSIGPAKKSRLARLAAHYCYEAEWEGPCRVDVVTVEMGADGLPSRVAHYRNAVSGEWG